jgi:hypothetical protein
MGISGMRGRPPRAGFAARCHPSAARESGIRKVRQSSSKRKIEQGPVAVTRAPMVPGDDGGQGELRGGGGRVRGRAPGCDLRAARGACGYDAFGLIWLWKF